MIKNWNHEPRTCNLITGLLVALLLLFGVQPGYKIAAQDCGVRVQSGECDVELGVLLTVSKTCKNNGCLE